VYFGASVTVQREGYRPALHERIRSRFEQEHRPLLAAVGATGLVSAACLADDLVASHRPDLCLIEYATPRAGTRELADGPAGLDGVFAKLLSVGCVPCLLHLYRRGDEQRAVIESLERIAEIHGVPTIDLATPIRAAIAAGGLEESELVKDGIHTTPVGSALTAELACDGIVELAGVDGSGPTLMAPPTDPSYRAAATVPATAEDAGGDGRMTLFRLSRPVLEVATDAVIRRRFDAALHGLALAFGPECGEIEVSADGRTERRMLFDDFCFYERFGTSLFKEPIPAGAEVSIRLTERVPDYTITRRPIDPPSDRRLKLFGYLVVPE
jgi:hypothetical protein